MTGRNPCCCSWGAALPDSSEWPEFECALCPRHGHGALEQVTPDSRVCKRHHQVLDATGLMSRDPAHAKNLGGRCAKCSNTYDRLYTRGRSAGVSHGRYCIHCVELENAPSRGGGPRGTTVPKPLNQPVPINMHGVPGYCIFCNAQANPRYVFQGFSFNACGWAHAGQWMDTVMDLILDPEPDFDLVEGEAYVRRSLGIE